MLYQSHSIAQPIFKEHVAGASPLRQSLLQLSNAVHEFVETQSHIGVLLRLGRFMAC
eukprot:CAMPEP_0185834724 /NCGR_PEP_ID=MMETSP1353-20130828/6070_1 /TAXON_ID=1077150 /ORGANISM="Erythrolobus australicus, Strain CCMP3124" /LENGTH=56 /DNA_ID=CAMNT_0028533215 /DNA_START=39 /DNA_END=206 /DNA_ORIENTATION=-